MGLLFSRFRKKPFSSKEILEGLENDIKRLTDRRQRNMYQEKSFIGYLLILSFLSYLIGALIFYVYYRPQNWLEYGLYSIPLVLFPIIIYLVKKLLNMYFAHKKAQYDQELSNMQAEKRKVLNEVMENETFNMANELLQRFDPQHPSLRATRERRDQGATPQRGGGEMRQRRSAQTPHPALLHQQHVRTAPQTVPRATRPSSHSHTLPPSQPAPVPTSTASSRAPPERPQQTSQVPQLPQNSQVPQTSQIPQSSQVPPHHATQFIPPGMCLGPAPGPPTPSPILPRERSGLDKMVEYLVGDGPNNRYALVCLSCHSHNGMALRDEFEYISFRCAYCFTFNPARRDKPVLRRPSTSVSLSNDSAKDTATAGAVAGEEEGEDSVAGGGGGGGKVEAEQRNGSTGSRDDRGSPQEVSDTEPAVAEGQSTDNLTTD